MTNTMNANYILTGKGKHAGKKLSEVDDLTLLHYAFNYAGSANAKAIATYMSERSVPLIESERDPRYESGKVEVTVERRGTDVADWMLTSGRYAGVTLREVAYSYLAWVVCIVLTDEQRTPSMLALLIERCAEYVDSCNPVSA